VCGYLGIDQKARQEEQQRRKQEKQRLILQQQQLQQQHMQNMINSQNINSGMYCTVNVYHTCTPIYVF
jgi:hypothetical protein